RSSVDSNGKLELKQVTSSDTGTYVCKAFNILGNKHSKSTIEVNSRPRVTLISGPVYEKIGTDIVMPKCHVTGHPKPTITWSKAIGSLNISRIIIKDGQVTLFRANKDDSGLYLCKAENLLGSVIKGTFLFVVGLPRFTITPPSSYNTFVGNTNYLNCTATGEPKPVIAWRRENGVLPIGRHEVKNGSFIVKDLKTTDSGVYICTAISAGVFHKQSRSTIKVHFRDCSEIFKSGERRNGEYTVNPDNQCSFQVYCDMSTDGGGWTVFQRRKDGSVDFYLNWQQYKTGFGNLNGEFWLGNDYIHRLTARTASSLRVEIEDWDGTRIYAKYGSFSVGDESDKYRLSVGGYSGTAGDSMTYHNNWAFTTKDRDNDGRLGEKCAVMRTGTYVCKAFNILGNKHSKSTIEVNSRPRVTLISGPVYEKIGTDIVMPKCHVTGHPKPKITWSKAIGSMNISRSVITEGQMTLLRSRKEDSGTYLCKAENLLGSVTKGTILIVVELPRFTVTPPSSYDTLPGKTIHLNCSATGEPKPVITWRKENGVLPIGRHEVRDGSLILKDSKTTDSGVFVCTATSAGVFHKESRSIIKIHIKDCSDIFKLGERRNGEYTVNPDNQRSFQVYCDMTTDGGRWTVFQRRKDGSVDFYRNWQQYKTGFGNLNGEFWLGNDYIHRLTARAPSSLRVEIEDWEGTQIYAKYGSFSVGDESDKYRLSVGGYSGTAGDSMAFHNNRAFTTKDRDNDGTGGNCAVMRTGAWWYYHCANSNLNGKYLGNVVELGGLEWYDYKTNYQSFKTSEMKLRPQNHK
ncbi:Ryncolin-2, partial [Exaiptasia diaphana]